MAEENSPADWSDLVRLLLRRVDDHAARPLLLLRELLTAARQVVNCSESAVMVPDSSGTNLKFLISVNANPATEDIVRSIVVPCDRSLAGCVFNTGQMIAIANPEQFYQAVDQKTGLQTSIYMVTPMLAGDEVLGVLTFVNRPEGQSPEPFNEAEIEWAQRLSDLAAAVVKLYQRTRLHRRMFRSELAEAAERFASDANGLAHAEESADMDYDESPIASAVDYMERMSRREQGVAVEMLRLLNSFDER